MFARFVQCTTYNVRIVYTMYAMNRMYDVHIAYISRIPQHIIRAVVTVDTRGNSEVPGSRGLCGSGRVLCEWAYLDWEWAALM